MDFIQLKIGKDSSSVAALFLCFRMLMDAMEKAGKK